LKEVNLISMKLIKLFIFGLVMLSIVAGAGISYASDIVIAPAGYMADTTTPFAVWFSSWTTVIGSHSMVTCKVRLQLPAWGINTLTNAYTWNTAIVSPAWTNDAQAWPSSHHLPIVSSGTVSGWLFAKSTSLNVGMSTCVVRMRFGSSNYDTYTRPELMAWNASMAGWLIDTCAFGAKIVALAKDSMGNILGSYITEDNGISEGYPTVPGYVKMAVPVGQVAFIEYRDLNNNLLGTKTSGPWTIYPGQETYTPVKLSRFEANILP
ncbi:MAG: hypothetical protein N3A72_12300, partial [bacterium]|nr:hypothetical protein [bacterium]